MKYIAIHNGHNSSITAFQNKEIILHFELERHLNIKNFIGINNNKIGECIDIVLNKLNWNHEEIEVVIFCGLVPWGGEWGQTEFKEITKNKKYEKNIKNPYLTWEDTWRKRKRKFIGITHHVNHMAYSYYTSPFKNALLFSIDGCGDFSINTTYGIGKKNKLIYSGNTKWENKDNIKYNNIGIAYGFLGHLFPFLGKDQLATAGKAMGLSAYGKIIENWRPMVQKILFPLKDEAQSDGSMEIKNKFHKLKSILNIDFNDCMSKDVHNLMATIQDEVEIYMSESIKKLTDIYNQKNVCLSGGCALNCKANSRIVEENDINLYIPPACSDTGLSIGAGLYYWYNICNNVFEEEEEHSAYLGSELINKEYKNQNITYKEIIDEDKFLEEVANKIIKRKIIAWVQNREEIGPRALGNRSILCLPFPASMKDLINEKIKHREYWRPFSAICLEEDFEEWFEINHPSKYMLECPFVKKEKRHLIPAVTHIDNTSRLQTVNEKQNLLIYKLLKKIKEKTKIPILLNTSLNDKNKPIANDLEVICNILLTTKLDYAVIDNKIYKKILYK